ncbi:epoxide hydrolase family protein [Nocardia noduli]|uniref:epoxide hydrolase family protein n=1 Tax=Nocardia noduli TaxID=2815722 RepID=UPI001C213B83|nr:epoxide hydrolase family protein [Nocardia noduli]
MTVSAHSVQPYRIDIPDSDIADLKARLSRTRWIDDLPGTGWERGVPASYLKEIAVYWGEKFDWRAQESAIAAHPQFSTVVDGQYLHFLHVRSSAPTATPLLLLHGWPGSVADFLDLIGPLTEPDADAQAFHLVIPSLPGHGFSGPLTEPGWNDGRVAGALDELMTRLGYDRYGVHGGDHGAFIAPRLGRLAPDRVIGVHVNALVTFPSGDPADMAALTAAERQRLEAMKRFQDDGSAYMALQGSRPNTIAQSLADSPAGQLAWIVEKYAEWTDRSHELPESAIDLDRILTTVSIHWFTATARSVANFYYERFHDAEMFAPRPKSTVPTGVAVFRDGDYAIRRFAERTHTVTHWSEFYSGGHFPALEVPDLLLDDIRAFFGSL